MSDSEFEQVVADEQAAEQKYNAALDEYARSAQRAVNSQLENTFTTSVRVDAPRRGELIGRVRLASDSELIESDQFYIGTAKGHADGLPVYSVWAPQIARAFYVGGHIEALGDVHGIRTLDHAGNGRITYFQDQALSAEAPSPLFPRRALVIPKPVARVAPVMVAPQPSTTPQTAEPANAKDTESVEPSERPSGPERSAEPAPTVPSSETLELRAEPILLRKLAAPKRGDMSPVLSTLQPDQYDAITRPATDSVIFQGHPGTGKTILAVHRAAFLTSPESRELGAGGLVMLIGPTHEYAEHVRPAVRALVGEDDENILILSLPALFHDLSGIKVDNRADTRVDDGTLVSEEIVKYLRATYNAVKRQGLLADSDRRSAVQIAYDRLRTDPAFPDGDVMDGDWYRYLRALPPFDEAASHPELRPLLAYFGIRFRKPFEFSDVAHIIVDESQDVHPLEWEILGRLGASKGWTILGDINQRRSEHTYRSWKPVALTLSIDTDGRAPIEELRRGYRSTGPIMRFANRLLARSERSLESLQADGPEPTMVRAPQRDKLAPTSVEQASLLVRRYRDGSVAIIAAATHHIATALRRAGWSAQDERGQSWTGPLGAIRLLTHDQARGLEFDAVIVVEPADFPTVEGEAHLGSLYTSLTRANKELVVVHHKPLPDKLRG